MVTSDAPGTDEYNAVELEAGDIGVQCQAIVVQVSGLWLPDPADTRAWGLIRSIECDEASSGEARTALTGTAAQDGKHFYALGAHTMLNDTNIGAPREDVADASAETHSQALAAGRRKFRDGIYQGRRKAYRTTAAVAALPQYGETVKIETDSFTGVMYMTPGINLSGAGAPIELTLMLIDLSSPVYS